MLHITAAGYIGQDADLRQTLSVQGTVYAREQMVQRDVAVLVVALGIRGHPLLLDRAGSGIQPGRQIVHLGHLSIVFLHSLLCHRASLFTQCTASPAHDQKALEPPEKS